MPQNLARASSNYVDPDKPLWLLRRWDFEFIVVRCELAASTVLSFMKVDFIAYQDHATDAHCFYLSILH